MTTALHTAVLAAGKTGESVKSGPIGLAVILLLCVASYFLFKSMSKHLKKVRTDFPTDEQGRPRTAAPAEQPEVAPTDEPAQSTDTPGERAP